MPSHARTAASAETNGGPYPPLPAAAPGERRSLESRAGRLSYYVAGEGEPLLLIHSINAAGSAYEVKPIFEWAMTRRKIYAPDLPGFGFSDRSERTYDIRLYVTAIAEIVDLIRAECGEAAIDAVALSLSSEFLARAAVERPLAFRSLALVTPTGFDKNADTRRGPAGKPRKVPGLYRAVRFPLWDRALYKGLVSPPSMRFFLRKTFGSDDFDQGLYEYDRLTARQPGARYAPYAFVSGHLFSGDIRTLYEALELPVWVGHGTRGDFQDFRQIGWTKARPNWSVTPFDTGALPHFERPGEFLAALERHLARA